MSSFVVQPRADFRSFWMGGFEAAAHINTRGERMDMVAATRHDALALTDYRLLQSVGMRTARDAFRWHLVDRGAGHYDFSSARAQLNAAVSTGTQVIWSLCHYGYPADLDLFSGEFVRRYVEFAKAALRLIGEHTREVPYITPVNEISFFSWAASRKFFYPFGEGRDGEIKQQLVRATIEACHAMRAIDGRVRFVYPEPIIHVVPGLGDLPAAVEKAEQSQFEAWDMIAGRQDAGLGGSPELLDIIGMNFYYTNEWELSGRKLVWDAGPQDSRWMPLREMMERIWKRYGRPLFLAETSHIGSGRAAWIAEVAAETQAALQRGVPLEGICLFPVIDRFDWEDPTHWHNSGLWEVRIADGSFERELNAEYAGSLHSAQQMLRR